MKKHLKQKYKSGLEEQIAKDLSKSKKVEYLYEPSEGKITWYKPGTIHTYTPDFWIRNKTTGNIICVETKGIWDYEDRFKHLLIKQLYPELDIRFIFSRSATRTSKGSKQTYADICSGKGRGPFKGVTWVYADKKIPKEWLV
jgi:hypothetical protein